MGPAHGGPAEDEASPFPETAMQDYELLRQKVEEIADDVAKAEGGNKAAGTRVRKAMQEIKAIAQEVRKKILEVRSVSE